MEHGGGQLLDENSFPPGYRFQPFDDQLINHYLTNKVKNLRLPPNRISEVKLYDYNPDDLVENYPSYGGNEWYFFTPRDRKYPNGTRPDRSAGVGYWKASGADKKIFSNGVEVGVKRTLVFYVKKSKEESEKDDKSKWIMQEYVLTEDAENPRPLMPNSMKLDDWVLCKIYERKGNWGTPGDDAVPDVKPKENKPKKQSQPKQKLKNESVTVECKTRGRKRKLSGAKEKEAGEADNNPSLQIPSGTNTPQLINTDGYIHGGDPIQIGTSTAQLQFPPPEPYYGYLSAVSNMDLAYNNHAECVTPISAVGPSNPVMPAFPMDYNYGFGSQFGYIDDELLRFKDEICCHTFGDNAYDSADFLIGATDVLPETSMPEDLPSPFPVASLTKLSESIQATIGTNAWS